MPSAYRLLGHVRQFGQSSVDVQIVPADLRLSEDRSPEVVVPETILAKFPELPEDPPALGAVQFQRSD